MAQKPVYVVVYGTAKGYRWALARTKAGQTWSGGQDGYSRHADAKRGARRALAPAAVVFVDARR